MKKLLQILSFFTLSLASFTMIFIIANKNYTVADAMDTVQYNLTKVVDAASEIIPSQTINSLISWTMFSAVLVALVGIAWVLWKVSHNPVAKSTESDPSGKTKSLAPCG